MNSSKQCAKCGFTREDHDDPAEFVPRASTPPSATPTYEELLRFVEGVACYDRYTHDDVVEREILVDIETDAKRLWGTHELSSTKSAGVPIGDLAADIERAQRSIAEWPAHLRHGWDANGSPVHEKSAIDCSACGAELPLSTIQFGGRLCDKCATDEEEGSNSVVSDESATPVSEASTGQQASDSASRAAGTIPDGKRGSTPYHAAIPGSYRDATGELVIPARPAETPSLRSMKRDVPDETLDRTKPGFPDETPASLHKHEFTVDGLGAPAKCWCGVYARDVQSETEVHRE